MIIPAGNVRHLMLDDKVIQAVEQGQFHIWQVETIDDAIPLVTGREAGQLQPDGNYPEGTFNRAVMDGLAELAEAAKPPAEEEEKKAPEKEEEEEAKPEESVSGR